ncbi:MAG: hypothetical protein J5828_00395 [Desulfovibrionaceae bacterium]|nr:hypothetical protein [Desulfovibrionaceae bacterium]
MEWLKVCAFFLLCKSLNWPFPANPDAAPRAFVMFPAECSLTAFMPDRLMETSTDAVRLRMPRLAYGVLHSINAQTAFMIMVFYARRMVRFAARPAARDCKNLMHHVKQRQESAWNAASPAALGKHACPVLLAGKADPAGQQEVTNETCSLYLQWKGKGRHR